MKTASRPRRLVLERLELRELLSAAGTLDSTFGGGRGFVLNQAVAGITSGSESSSSETVKGIFALPDGKVEVAVEVSVFNQSINFFSSSTTSLVLERFNADGSVDTTFGQGGQVTVPAPFNTSYSESNPAAGSISNAVVMQADGKIIAVGDMPLGIPEITNPSSAYAAIRINVDGSVDTTYGNDGLATYPAGVQSSTNPGLTDATAAALQPDGELILAGGPNFSAVRLKTDGSLDTSFGYGSTTTLTPAPSIQASNVVIQPNGDIVIAGSMQELYSAENAGDEYGVVRLLPTGKVDTSFGTNGVVTLPTGPNPGIETLSASLTGLASQSNGKIVISTEEFGSIGDFAFDQELRQLNADGSVDDSFGHLGTITAAVAGPVAIQADGGIVVGGSLVTATGLNNVATHTIFAAERFNPDGSADGSFGNTPTYGLAGYDFGEATVTSSVTALAIQPDGNILLGGPATSINNSSLYDQAGQLGLARVLGQANTSPPALSAAATPPASFDGSGKSDVAVYLPALGSFAYRPSNGTADVIIPFGIAGAGQTLPAAADYAGTGTTQIAAYLPALGDYAIRPASGPDELIPFGIAGAGQSLPAPGDYEGTGKDDIAVYLPSIGSYAIRPSTGGADEIVSFGIAGAGQSIPVPGDYEGTGKDDIAVYLPSLGAYAIRPSTGGADEIIPFGIAGAGNSIPAPGDYDGSGKTELAVYLPSLGLFAYRPANGGPDVLVAFGGANRGAIPVPGDYTGSGHTEIAIYDPLSGAFAYRPADGSPDVVENFGIAGAGQSIPVTANASVAATLASALSVPVSAASVSPIQTASVPSGPVTILAIRRTAKTSVLQANPQTTKSGV